MKYLMDMEIRQSEQRGYDIIIRPMTLKEKMLYRIDSIISRVKDIDITTVLIAGLVVSTVGIVVGLIVSTL